MPINVLLIFNMRDQNGALFLKVSVLFLSLALFSPSTVLNLIFLLTEYGPLDKSFTSIHFLSQIWIQLNRLII